MTLVAKTTVDMLRQAYNETWEAMERQFEQTFNVVLSDQFPELTHRFVGEYREPGGRYQALVDEVFALDEDEVDGDSAEERSDACCSATGAIDAFLNSVSPKSTYNANILRCIVYGWHCLQCAQDFIAHAECRAATYLLCLANRDFGAAEGVSLCRDTGRQIASKAGQKRHERSPEIKRDILDKYQKHISPDISASQAALQLHAMGVPFNIEGITRIIRAERKRRHVQPA